MSKTEHYYRGVQIVLNPNRRPGATSKDPSYYWKARGFGIYKTLTAAKRAIDKELGPRHKTKRTRRL